MKLVLIEDDPALNNSLKAGLESSSYAVTSFTDGIVGEKHLLLNAVDYDLAILDWMLPHKSGIDICAHLRSQNIVIPILMLTGKDASSDKVAALDAGADDYLTKPFSFEELLARVRALLRRPHNVLKTDLLCADLRINLVTRKVYREDKEIPLTLKEFNILEYFIRNPNQVLTRDQILDHVWDYSFSSLSNIMDVHITNLRKKLDKDNKEHYIETVRGIGYIFKT